MRRLLAVLTGIASFLLTVFLVAGCSAGTTSTASPTTTAASSEATSTSPAPLEGRWATGPIPIADIKARMVAAGVKPSEADSWAVEVGSPTQFSFLLEFAGTDFTHSEETPDMEMQVGESGTYAYSGTRLVLTVGEVGNVDTNTFETTLSGDELSLQYIESTEEGTAEDKAKHRIYTIAFYCSGVFTRQ